LVIPRLAVQRPASPGRLWIETYDPAEIRSLSRPILVVDDDPMIVRLVRTYLEREGFAIVTAADGPSALEAQCHQMWW
jgi:PleD family two-component response regulator